MRSAFVASCQVYSTVTAFVVQIYILCVDAVVFWLQWRKLPYSVMQDARCYCGALPNVLSSQAHFDANIC